MEGSAKKRKIAHSGKRDTLAATAAASSPSTAVTAGSTEEDGKPKAVSSSSDTVVPFHDEEETSQQQQQDEKTRRDDAAAAWNAVLERLPRCTSAEGVRETSSFRNRFQPTGGGGGRNTCLRKLLQELGSLEENLPTDPAVWVRFDEETPQFLRALVTAPTGTPYALGLFCFDLFVPDAYPSVAPKVRLLTTGGGTVRFSPNLYENGTVCLSLLGTWSGPKWNPLHSTILQVLVSIQGLILGVEHPYYLEPGFGGWEESVNKGAPVPPQVKVSDAKIREGTVKYAMTEACKVTPKYLHAFSDVISAHFAHYKDTILKEVRTWGGMDRRRKQMHLAIRQLEGELAKIKPTNVNAKDAPMTNGDGKADVNGIAQENGEDPALAAKRHAMEQAAKLGDYITAGQVQAELQYLQVKGVHAMVSSKRREMEEAAAQHDYITAGRLQERVRYLEQHKRRLQELPRRMFEAASKQDFVRAGRFQEQYHILLDSNDSADRKSTSSSSSAAAAANPPAMWDQGMFFNSLPIPTPPGMASSGPPHGGFHVHPDDGMEDDGYPDELPGYDYDEDDGADGLVAGMASSTASVKKAMKALLGSSHMSP